MQKTAHHPCNLCDSTLVEKVADSGRDGNALRTVICKQCGLVWTDPRPKDAQIEQYYSEEYRKHYKATITPKPKHIHRAGKLAAERFSLYKKLFKSGDVFLDIGSGGGEWIYLLQSKGIHANGLEPNQGYANFSKENYNIPVQVGTIQTCSFEKESFNAISMFHVLEHLTDPFAALSRCYDLLKNDGFLIIEVPNVESTCQAPKNKFHSAHLYNFNPLTLEQMGKKANFLVSESVTSSDNENITVIFKKTMAKNKSASTFEYDNHNYKNINKILNKHTPLKHFSSSQPYTRLSRKIKRMLHEHKQTLSFKNAKQYLDELYKDHERIY